MSTDDRPARPSASRALGLFAAVTCVLALLAASACSSDEGAESGDDGVTSTTPGDTGEGAESGDDEAAIDESIVVIGEEYLLADLLALGITPLASTATVAEEGFHALDDYDTSGIEALPATEANIELLASLEPDHIITLEFFAEQIGMDVLEGMAEVTVIPDGISPTELVTTYGEMFAREDRAAELVAEYDEAMELAAAELDGAEVSVAAIYAGPSVALFVDGPWAVPATLLESGASLVPTPEEAAPDENGRAYVSMERLDLASAPQMVLLQTPLVEGEAESVEEVQQSSLWQTLPAVQAGEVTELDRLGYPGIEGRIRLVDDLVAALGQ